MSTSLLGAWIGAARLRTLPLAIATMSVGHALSYEDGRFRWSIFWLSLGTAIALQILSNLANDYGDSIHGADHDGRQGPRRAVQSGVISLALMKRSMMLFGVLSFVLGTVLTLVAFDDMARRLVFIALGCAAIWAAINYTAGPKPYGYRGKGDIAVFLFFGLVTVLGAYYLQSGTLDWSIVLPAIACGTLSVGVLNVNNIRDIESDRAAGKLSIPVKMGRDRAVRYHGVLLVLAVLSLVAYNMLHQQVDLQYWLFMIGVPMLVLNFRAVSTIKEAMELDPYLKQLALSSALILLLFSLSRIL